VKGGIAEAAAGDHECEQNAGVTGRARRRQGGTSTICAAAAAVPHWVRLVRSGARCMAGTTLSAAAGRRSVRPAGPFV